MKFKAIILFLFLSGNIFSQSIPLQLFSSSGGCNEIHQNLNMNWAIGETFTEPLYSTDSNRIITQGFHQDTSFYDPLVKIFEYQLGEEVVVTLFPNPVKDILKIRFIKSDKLPDQYQITIYNMMGSIVLSKKCDATNLDINLHDLLPGSYLLCLDSKENSFICKYKIQKVK